MKIIKFYATTLSVLVMALLLLTVPVAAQALQGNGVLKSETRNASGFKGIQIGGGFKVELTQGNKESVRIEAEENLLPYIKTEVKNGILHVYSDKSWNSTKGMTAYITLKELQHLGISGGVKVDGKSVFKTNTIKMDLSGGSKVALALNADKLDADISGASKVNLTGKADDVRLDLSGATNIVAEELVAKNVRVEASGASKVKVYAKDNLEINASGASAVYYKGSPKITSDTSAASRISKL